MTSGVSPCLPPFHLFISSFEIGSFVACCCILPPGWPTSLFWRFSCFCLPSRCRSARITDACQLPDPVCMGTEDLNSGVHTHAHIQPAFYPLIHPLSPLIFYLLFVCAHGVTAQTHVPVYMQSLVRGQLWSQFSFSHLCVGSRDKLRSPGNMELCWLSYWPLLNTCETK